MVGKRDINFRSCAHKDQNQHGGDLENGRRRTRFQDTVDAAVDNQRRTDLKAKLKEGIDRDGLEKYRKSSDEVGGFFSTLSCDCCDVLFVLILTGV